MAKLIGEKIFGDAKYRIFIDDQLKKSKTLFETDDREVFLEEWDRLHRSLYHNIDTMVSFDFEDVLGYRHGGGGGDRNRVNEFINKYLTKV